MRGTGRQLLGRDFGTRPPRLNVPFTLWTRRPGLTILGVTVLEAIQRSTEFLARKGVDSPRLQTELLLAHLLQQPRMRLYLEFERVLTPPEVDGLRT